MMLIRNCKQVTSHFNFQNCIGTYFIKRHASSSGEALISGDRFKEALRTVPQPVVVVTGSVYNDKTGSWYKRGITCSSFTSVSLTPPIISFAMNNPSRMHTLLLEAKQFAVNVLAGDQVATCLHFAKPAVDDKCQFTDIPHTISQDLPILDGANSVLYCGFHSVHTVGDHFVWYGNVHNVTVAAQLKDPMLYYSRKLRSIGDDVFIKSFEDTTLPFMDWTHEAHLRMAWNYISEYGIAKATPLIKTGIKRFNERNKDKITHGYHETITEFYIHMVNAALSSNSTDCFDDFIEKHDYLKDTALLLEYYTMDIIRDKNSKEQFIPPDKKALPSAERS